MLYVGLMMVKKKSYYVNGVMNIKFIIKNINFSLFNDIFFYFGLFYLLL